ncbi:MAG: phytanoyl-CoA dioxygenase family protein [Chlamydiia bacterium]|nr:phytanoyl-CoA dioxygenase family protein [Chlamydiia bacterium]
MIDIEHFSEKGWVVIDFIDPQPVFQARDILQNRLDKLLGKHVPLEDYHTVIVDDEQHTEVQVQMTAFFREQNFGKSIIEKQLPLFKPFLGLDLFVQRNPYLRMARPGKPQDNIGYHRDTFYGGSPYELSVLVPFVDVAAPSALQVMTGSHTLPENHFPTVQIENPDEAVRKGSAKHQLGFLYAPKVMDPSIEKDMLAVPLKLGQAIAFSLSTVHGCIVNQGTATRWSSDIRVMNAFAPVDLSARPDYYQPLSSSAMTAQAQEYLTATANEANQP